MADKPLKVYAIEESPSSRKYWREVGVAFKCSDGSLNVKIYMFPLLKLNIREQTDGEPKEPR
jgi:hypothetical protein